MIAVLRSLARHVVPRPLRRSLSNWGTRATRWPPVGAVRFGSFERTTPISADWGFDRGLPIDRYFIERFMEREASLIRGRVLEIDTNDYTVRFGQDRVVKSDVLHIAEKLPGVTLVGDLTDAGHLPANAFDCVILTQTLQLIYDVRAALTTVHRILRPGGAALVTVPGISKMTRDQEGKWGYFWGFTTLSAHRLFQECFPGGEVRAEGWGNVLTAVGFLHGIAAEELDPDALRQRDPDFEVLVTIRAVKAGG
jgi:SAM-dependent methyltransferase